MASLSKPLKPLESIPQKVGQSSRLGNERLHAGVIRLSAESGVNRSQKVSVESVKTLFMAVSVMNGCLGMSLVRVESVVPKSGIRFNQHKPE
jgi:hypothetical protein